MSPRAVQQPVVHQPAIVHVMARTQHARVQDVAVAQRVVEGDLAAEAGAAGIAVPIVVRRDIPRHGGSGRALHQEIRRAGGLARLQRSARHGARRVGQQ